MTCEDCRKKGHYVAKDRGQGVVKEKEWEKLKKYKGYAKKGKGKAVYPIKRKVQLSGTWAKDPEDIAKEGSCQREVWRTFKILKKM